MTVPLSFLLHISTEISSIIFSFSPSRYRLTLCSPAFFCFILLRFFAIVLPHVVIDLSSCFSLFSLILLLIIILPVLLVSSFSFYYGSSPLFFPHITIEPSACFSLFLLLVRFFSSYTFFSLGFFLILPYYTYFYYALFPSFIFLLLVFLVFYSFFFYFHLYFSVFT